MVCLAEKIGDGTCRRGRGGVGRRVVAARRRKAANAPFALQSYPQGGNGVAAGTVKYLYYSNNWQVLETRWNGTAATDVAHQYVWSQMYIDAMVLRDTYSGGAIQPDARIYTQFDANYNVTALIGYNAGTNTWGVVQRYVYTPYGVATVLDANWNATTGQFAWRYMHQGGRQDPITGLYLFRHRDYSPTLGNWIEQDPAGYINGGSRYQFVGGAPAANSDPAGLWSLFKWLYTGNGDAPNWEYNAAVDGAGAWLYVNSPVRGAYVYAGKPVNNTPGFADTFAAEGQWTIDNGWSAGAGAYFMYQTKAVPGLWGGVGVYGYWNQDNGWGLGGLPIVGAGNPGELNFGGAEVGFGTSGAIYFGLGGKYGGAGLILDPSRFGNLLNPNANDQQIDRLVYGSHRRRRRGVGNPCP